MDLTNFVPIKGFEDTHLICAETQEVYSLLKRKVLKGNISEGYITFELKSPSGMKSKKLHRLMMETFVDNPNNYDCINHIDGNKLNNSLDNLEWCSRAWNNKEAYRLGLRKVSDKTVDQFKRDCLKAENIAQGTENLKRYKEKAIQKSKETNSIPVIISKGDLTKYFASIRDAADFIGAHYSNVAKVRDSKYKCRGYEVTTAKGDPNDYRRK